MDKENIEINKDIQALVIERLRTLPDDKNISIGSDGEFTKEDLISHVEKRDDLGKKIIDIEMSFLRGLKEGILYDSDYLVGDTA